MKPKEQPQIVIFTFGQFAVRRGEQLITTETKKAQKAWTLFQYLLTHKGNPVSVDTLIEDLWPEQEFDNPKDVLKALVYRLRNLLGQKRGSNQAQYILNAQGSYGFNHQVDYWLDAEEFESLNQQASKIASEDPEEAIKMYQKALALYKGDYLLGNQHATWAIHTRNHYRRLYLEKVKELIQLLKQKSRWGDIRGICEKTFQIEPLDENLHLYFMESLLEEGRTSEARSHYQYISSLFFQHQGVSPSPAMREIYRRMIADNDNLIMDVRDIQEGIRTRDATDGAFFCDSDSFRLFYRLEERRIERNGQAVFLISLTITDSNHNLPVHQALGEAMKQLGVALKESLRKGDIICRWNEAQYLILLPNLNFEQLQKVLDRVKSNFQGRHKQNKIRLRTQYHPLQPQSLDSATQ